MMRPAVLRATSPTLVSTLGVILRASSQFLGKPVPTVKTMGFCLGLKDYDVHEMCVATQG